MAKEEIEEDEEEEEEKPRVRIVRGEEGKSKKEGFRATLIEAIILSAVIVFVIYFTQERKEAIGPILVILGFLPSLLLYLAGRGIKSALADIVFGVINTGILGVMTLTGANLNGILGAVIGVAIGNTIINGIAGMFEGKAAEYLRKHKLEEERTSLSASMGKMSGCLIGIGITLTVAWTIMGL